MTSPCRSVVTIGAMSGAVTLDDPTVQVVEGTLYVSARDALEGWDAAAEPYQCTLSWDPITQRIDGTFGGVTSFQAGSRPAPTICCRR